MGKRNKLIFLAAKPKSAMPFFVNIALVELSVLLIFVNSLKLALSISTERVMLIVRIFV